MAKYGKKAQSTVRSAMKRRKSGTLRSGSGAKVTSRKQAIAIGLSEARQKGAKVPGKKTSRTTARKKSAGRKPTKRMAKRGRKKTTTSRK